MVKMRGAIAAALILISGGNTGHVEGAEKDRWGSDQVYLGGHHGHLGRHHEHRGRHHGHLGGHHGGADDEHGQPGRLTDNIDLGAKARAANRSGKCELFLNAPVVCLVKLPFFLSASTNCRFSASNRVYRGRRLYQPHFYPGLV